MFAVVKDDLKEGEPFEVGPDECPKSSKGPARPGGVEHLHEGGGVVGGQQQDRLE